MANKQQDLCTENLILMYKPLVAFFARKYAGYGLSFDDLMQEGMLGLLEAGTKFDTSKNVQFETYAGFWIKKYILKAVDIEMKHSNKTLEINEDTLAYVQPEIPNKIESKIVLPVSMPGIEQQIIKLSYDSCLTVKEIALHLNLTSEKVRQIRDKALRRLRKDNNKYQFINEF